jgi:hypothetical protein
MSWRSLKIQFSHPRAALPDGFLFFKLSGPNYEDKSNPTENLHLENEPYKWIPHTLLKYVTWLEKCWFHTKTVMKCMTRKWVAGPPIESLLIKGFHNLRVQRQTRCPHYRQEFTGGKLMVLRRQKKLGQESVNWCQHWRPLMFRKRQILVSLGSTALGAHGWHTVLLEAETAALLTVQVDLLQQAVPIHFTNSFLTVII